MGDSKVNPDVLLLLISRADEWEGKITGASLGGPVCRPCHPGASQPPSAYLHAPSAGEGALRWDPLQQTTHTDTHTHTHTHARADTHTRSHTHTRAHTHTHTEY